MFQRQDELLSAFQIAITKGETSQLAALGYRRIAHTHYHDHDAIADGHAHDHGMGASVAHPVKSDRGGKSNGFDPPDVFRPQSQAMAVTYRHHIFHAALDGALMRAPSATSQFSLHNEFGIHLRIIMAVRR